MADRLREVEIFVRAIRTGSLSAAAREFGISPAMAAKHLTALEARLGATLINRTTRRLALTGAGEEFIDKAERILGDIDEAEAAVSARTVTVAGLLRINAPVTFGLRHIAGLVTDFRLRHPAVTIELGLTDRYVDLLEERWDMAIRIGRLRDSSLVARKLADVRLNICAAPAYLAANGTPGSPAELTGHECLGYTLSPATGTSHWAFGRDGGDKVRVRGWLHANNGEALVEAAIAGQGLVYGPRFMTAAAIRAGRLVELDLGVPLLDLGAVYAVSHPTRRPAAAARAWSDFLAQHVRKMANDW